MNFLKKAFSRKVKDKDIKSKKEQKRDKERKKFKVINNGDRIQKENIDKLLADNPNMTFATASKKAQVKTREQMAKTAIDLANKYYNKPDSSQNLPTYPDGKPKPTVHTPYYANDDIWKHVNIVGNITTMDDISALLLRPRNNTPQQALITYWQEIVDSGDTESIRNILRIIILHNILAATHQIIFDIIGIDNISKDGSYTIKNLLPLSTNIMKKLSLEDRKTVIQKQEDAYFAFYNIQDLIKKYKTNTKNKIIPYEVAKTLFTVNTNSPYMSLLSTYMASGHYTLINEPQHMTTSHTTQQIQEILYLADLESRIPIQKRPYLWFKSMFKILQNSPNSEVATDNHADRNAIYNDKNHMKPADYFKEYYMMTPTKQPARDTHSKQATEPTGLFEHPSAPCQDFEPDETSTPQRHEEPPPYTTFNKYTNRLDEQKFKDFWETQNASKWPNLTDIDNTNYELDDTTLIPPSFQTIQAQIDKAADKTFGRKECDNYWDHKDRWSMNTQNDENRSEEETIIDKQKTENDREKFNRITRQMLNDQKKLNEEKIKVQEMKDKLEEERKNNLQQSANNSPPSENKAENNEQQTTTNKPAENTQEGTSQQDSKDKERTAEEQKTLEEEEYFIKWKKIYEKLDKETEISKLSAAQKTRVLKEECQYAGLDYKKRPTKEEVTAKTTKSHKITEPKITQNIYRPINAIDNNNLKILTNRLKTIPLFKIGDSPKPFLRHIQDIMIDYNKITPLNDEDRYKLMFEKLDPEAAGRVYDNAMIQRGNPIQLSFYIENVLGLQKSDVQEIADIDKIEFKPGTYSKCMDKIERTLACNMQSVGEDFTDPVAYQAYQNNCLTTAINRLYQSNKHTYGLMIGNGVLEEARKDKNYPLFRTKLQEFDKHALDMNDETAEDTLNYKVINTKQTKNPPTTAFDGVNGQTKQNPKPNNYNPISNEYTPPPNIELQPITNYTPNAAVSKENIPPNNGQPNRNNEYQNNQNSNNSKNIETALHRLTSYLEQSNNQNIPKPNQPRQYTPFINNKTPNRNFPMQPNPALNQNNTRNKLYCYVCNGNDHNINFCPNFRPVQRRSPVPPCPNNVTPTAKCKYCPELTGDHYSNYCPKVEYIPINNNNPRPQQQNRQQFQNPNNQQNQQRSQNNRQQFQNQRPQDNNAYYTNQRLRQQNNYQQQQTNPQNTPQTNRPFQQNQFNAPIQQNTEPTQQTPQTNQQNQPTNQNI